jgi:hypothetical protein
MDCPSSTNHTAQIPAICTHTRPCLSKKHTCGAKNIEELSFATKPGIGQEDNASRLQWTLLYDMVSEWVDSKNRQLHVNENLREYSNAAVRDAAPYAYAVDLLAAYSAGPQVEYMQPLQSNGSPYSVNSLD